MTAVPYIACDGMEPDGEPCPVYDHPYGGGRTFTRTRAVLKEQGWHRTRDGRDICPVCWERGQR